MINVLKSLMPLVQRRLEQGEEVAAAALCTYDSTRFGRKTMRQGVLAATDRRVLRVGSRLGGFEIETIPYERVSSIERSQGLFGSTIRFHSSDSVLEARQVFDTDASLLVSTVQNGMDRARRHNAPPGPPDDETSWA